MSKDHVPLYISYPPRLSVSEIMKLLKGRTSRKLQPEFPQMIFQSSAPRLSALSSWFSLRVSVGFSRNNACGNQQYHCKTCGAYGVLEPHDRYTEDRERAYYISYQERSSMRGIERSHGIFRQTVNAVKKRVKSSGITCHPLIKSHGSHRLLGSVYRYNTELLATIDYVAIYKFTTATLQSLPYPKRRWVSFFMLPGSSAAYWRPAETSCHAR